MKMQTQTGGHIQIAKESEMKPGETMRRVTIRGSEGAVKELKYRIEETVANKTGRSMSSGPKEQKELETAFVLKVVIPNDKVGYGFLSKFTYYLLFDTERYALQIDHRKGWSYCENDSG